MATRRAAFKHGRRWAKPVDQSTLGQAVRQAGIDPRQWVSIGIVTPGSQGDDIVVFDEDEGQPLVSVLLEPTKIPVRARVSGQVAGNGEGDWHPFVEGDEVVVVIPEGNERSGCVIIGRLSNGIDKFPMGSVAGQDPTTNTFAFSRRRTPRIEEFNGPIVFRSAMSEALISLDTAGVFTVRTGDKSVLQMSPDAIMVQGPSEDGSPPELALQLNHTDKHFTVTVGDAILNLSASGATPEPNNIISVPDNLTLNAGGNASSEHAMTAEAFWHCLTQALQQIGLLITALGPTPLTGVALGALFTAPALAAPFALAIPLAATTPDLFTSTPLATAWPLMPPKSPAVIQMQPGLGSATILIG
jgi:hypothetical protein